MEAGTSVNVKLKSEYRNFFVRNMIFKLVKLMILATGILAWIHYHPSPGF